jgi:hypothetical protein
MRKLADSCGTEITPGAIVAYNFSGQVVKGVVLRVRPNARGYHAVKVEIVRCADRGKAHPSGRAPISKMKNVMGVMVLDEMLPSRVIRREMDERRKHAQCCARIWHGGGHQSGTYCEIEGPHDMHKAVYGEFNQLAEWRTGQFVENYALAGADWWDPRDGITGFFDEPPQEDED